MELQHIESPQSKPYRGEKIEPKEQKRAAILPFRRKTEARAEEGQGYEEYKSSGGILSREQYQDVLTLAAHGGDAPSNSLSPGHANFMAEEAGISLSPETVSIYAMLRDRKPDPENEKFSGLSDQKLLAETLRIVGDTRSRNAFEKKYPHIFH